MTPRSGAISRPCCAALAQWRPFFHLRCGSSTSAITSILLGRMDSVVPPHFRPEFGVYSPTKVHIAMLIEEAAAWVAGFDFLLGTEEYKSSWCNDVVEVVNIHAGFHQWAPTYFWFSRGKPFARRKLQSTYFRARHGCRERARAGDPNDPPIFPAAVTSRCSSTGAASIVDKYQGGR